MTITVNSQVREASPRQIAFLRELARERVMPENARKRLSAHLDAHEYNVTRATNDWAKASIKWCLDQPVIPGLVPNRIAAMPLAERSVRPTPERPNEFRITSAPQRPSGVQAGLGVYVKNGDIYIVKEFRDTGKHYARKLVLSPPRITENGEEVDFDYQRAPGMVYRLTESDRMPEADMKDFILKYSRCIRCGHGLKAAKTLKRAAELKVLVGPRCAKKMGLA
jgi:hypothetical protein